MHTHFKREQFAWVRPKAGSQSSQPLTEGTDHFESVHSCSCDTCSCISDDDYSSDHGLLKTSDGKTIPEEAISHQDLDFALPNTSKSGRSLSDQSSSRSSGFDENDYAKLFQDQEYYNFEPLYLHKQSLGKGKLLHVMELPSFRMSMLPYVNADDLMEEHIRQFQMRHPRIDSGILLSDLIKLKDDLVDIFFKEKQDLKSNESEETYVQIYSIAHAWVLFERLVYKNIIKQS